MAAIRLTQRRVDSLRPRKTVRNVRDAELKGYGVRITPSGAKRYFIHSQHRGHRVWKIVGDAAVMSEAEEVFTRYGRRWKPRTLAVNRRYLIPAPLV